MEVLIKILRNLQEELEIWQDSEYPLNASIQPKCYTTLIPKVQNWKYGAVYLGVLMVLMIAQSHIHYVFSFCDIIIIITTSSTKTVGASTRSLCLQNSIRERLRTDNRIMKMMVMMVMIHE